MPWKQDTVDKLFTKKESTAAPVPWSTAWREQFIEAITVQVGDEGDGEDGAEGDEDGEQEEKMPSCCDYVMHFACLFWKLLFAFVPPTDYYNGWACFTASITVIGMLTAVIGDLASHFGCSIGLKDAVTAITFVALGTSLPDTFASKVAAVNDQYADSSIGNVTGSNAVNVFLGIGIAWSLAAIVHAWRGTEFTVEPGSLAFSVTVFCILAAITCACLMTRRAIYGGELGGPLIPKAIMSSFMVFIWFLYCFLSSLDAYKVVDFGI